MDDGLVGLGAGLLEQLRTWRGGRRRRVSYIRRDFCKNRTVFWFVKRVSELECAIQFPVDQAKPQSRWVVVMKGLLGNLKEETNTLLLEEGRLVSSGS